MTGCKGGEVEVPLMIQDSTTAEGPAAYKKCVKEKPQDWGGGDESDWPDECEIYIMGKYGNFE